MRTPAARAGKIVVTALPVIAGLLVFAAPGRTAAPGPPPSAIVWGDGVFSNRTAIADWLSSRGASYGRWARLHPAARDVVEHKRRRAAATADTRIDLPAQPSGGAAAWTRKIELVLLAGAALVMLVAVMPMPRIALPGVGLSATQRAYVFAIGLAVCVGVGIAVLRA